MGAMAAGARLRNTIDNTYGIFQGWADDGAALVIWEGRTEPEATFHWDRARTFVTPVRHRDGRGLGT